jgi:hypothetical protein
MNFYSYINMRKKILIILILSLFFFIPGMVSAQDPEINLYFFESKSCPHCTKEKIFLKKIAPDYPNLKIHDFEVGVGNNSLLLRTIGEKLNIDVRGVPITIIGKDYFVGYFNDETTGKTITNLIEKYEKEGDPDLVGVILREFKNNQTTPSPTVRLLTTPTPIAPVETETPDKDTHFPEQIIVPVLGSIEIKDLSLPVLTIVLGGLDGFNPCAMWVLLFLISLLLGMKDKKRRWILGTTFIVASAFVYFLFMAAWLNFLLFVGFVVWVRILIGLIALGGGSYNLREYFINKESGCKVTGNEKRQAIFEKLKAITKRRQFILALGGIILLAFAVNLVELVCSAGLPVVFTQILTLSNLTTWQYYAYMLLYIFIFMLDDLFVFFTAMVTLEVTGISTKYTRASHLIGGVLMIIIGLLIIFKPEVLMFG